MKNKKGFLLAEETLKIIIALVSITFLVYFLVSLYFANQDSKDLELAEESLEFLISEIERGATEVEIYNPVNGFKRYWYMFTWPTEGDQIKPQACLNFEWENCVCICGVSSFEGWSKQDLADICDERGICLEFTDLKIKKNNGFFSEGVSGAFYVYDDILTLVNPPIKLNIDREERVIEKNES